MANQLNDLWVSYLKSEGYTGKQYNDLTRRALQDQTGTTRKQLNDLWSIYLKSQGYLGSIPGMMYKWLGDKGYEGGLNDRWVQSIKAGDVFGFNPSSLFSGGEEGFWYDLTDSSTMAQDDANTVPVTSLNDPVGYVEDLSGNGHHFSATTFLPEWGESPYGNNTLEITGTSDRFVIPNLGSVSGQLYLSYDGNKSIVANATMNKANVWLRQRNCNPTCVLFIDREFTAEEISELDSIYQESPYSTTNTSYSSFFDLLPITSVVTDLSTFGTIQTSEMFRDCDRLTQAPDFDLVGNITSMYDSCSALTSYPNVDMSGVSRCFSTWRNCSLTSFPAADLSGSDDFHEAWRGNDFVSFPAVNFGSSNGDFDDAWLGNFSMTTFPANMFDSCTTNNYEGAFRFCALSETSVDNILVSVDTAGQTNGVIHLQDGTSSAPGAAGTAAISNLTGKGWTVITN